MGEKVYQSARRSLAVLVSLLAAAAALVALFLASLPPLQLVAQRDALLGYAAQHPAAVWVGWVGAYLLMQTFAVPGTLALTLLGGALYGARRGWALVAVVSTLGSCSCYCLSWAVGRPLVAAAWPRRTAAFREQVQRRRADLLNYIIFLRVTPLLPNTFVNVASPIVGVPLPPFALGTLLGCLPNNFLAVNAGARLGELQSLADLADPNMLLFGLVVGGIALLPVWLKHRHGE